VAASPRDTRLAGCSQREHGTRIRDLRSDKPVLALAEYAAIGGDSRREQVFPTLAMRRALPGTGRDSRGFLRDVRGMSHCLNGKHLNLWSLQAGNR
jgi:hypothetical protein